MTCSLISNPISSNSGWSPPYFYDLPYASILSYSFLFLFWLSSPIPNSPPSYKLYPLDGGMHIQASVMTHFSSDPSLTFLGFRSSLATPTTSCTLLSLLANSFWSLLLYLLLSLLTSVSTLTTLNLNDIATLDKSADQFYGLGKSMTPLSTWHFLPV